MSARLASGTCSTMKVGSWEAALDVAELVAAHRHGQVLVDGVHRDAVADGLLGIDLEAPVARRAR
jgi:hypothetical protein